VWFVRPQQKQYLIIIFFGEYGLQCSVVLSTFVSVFRQLVFTFLPPSFDAVCNGTFSLATAWQTARDRLRDFFVSAALVYTVSNRAGTWKCVSLCDPSFGEVLGHLQEGLSDVESESV
jgi:hypothetical protein